MATKTKTPKVINPLTGDPHRPDVAAYLVKLRAARRGARHALRSGNPAVRADAAKALLNIPAMIRQVHMREASR